jgi:hypothetical protein
MSLVYFSYVLSLKVDTTTVCHQDQVAITKICDLVACSLFYYTVVTNTI